VFRQPDRSWDDKKLPETYKENLAVVKIDKARRSGVFRERIDYIKQGEWLVEWGTGQQEEMF
jgi:hypothetical protein